LRLDSSLSAINGDFYSTGVKLLAFLLGPYSIFILFV